MVENEKNIILAHEVTSLIKELSAMGPRYRKNLEELFPPSPLLGRPTFGGREILPITDEKNILLKKSA